MLNTFSEYCTLARARTDMPVLCVIPPHSCEDNLPLTHLPPCMQKQSESRCCQHASKVAKLLFFDFSLSSAVARCCVRYSLVSARASVNGQHMWHFRHGSTIRKQDLVRNLMDSFGSTRKDPDPRMRWSTASQYYSVSAHSNFYALPPCNAVSFLI